MSYQNLIYDNIIVHSTFCIFYHFRMGMDRYDQFFYVYLSKITLYYVCYENWHSLVHLLHYTPKD